MDEGTPEALIFLAEEEVGEEVVEEDKEEGVDEEETEVDVVEREVGVVAGVAKVVVNLFCTESKTASK